MLGAMTRRAYVIRKDISSAYQKLYLSECNHGYNLIGLQRWPFCCSMFITYMYMYYDIVHCATACMALHNYSDCTVLIDDCAVLIE